MAKTIFTLDTTKKQNYSLVSKDGETTKLALYLGEEFLGSIHFTELSKKGEDGRPIETYSMGYSGELTTYLDSISEKHYSKLMEELTPILDGYKEALTRELQDTLQSEKENVRPKPVTLLQQKIEEEDAMEEYEDELHDLINHIRASALPISAVKELLSPKPEVIEERTLTERELHIKNWLNENKVKVINHYFKENVSAFTKLIPGGKNITYLESSLQMMGREFDHNGEDDYFITDDEGNSIWLTENPSMAFLKKYHNQNERPYTFITIDIGTMAREIGIETPAIEEIVTLMIGFN